ncbi:PIN domain-containing protein [Nocardia asteroides]|uniref:PIN domain-containing protein n=1 Tax=Nocardia asteroides TaxID=1824 RepID=UPI001E3113F7|nr:PIN domain-containing protein [Nocardia asteroides]UGT64249.1 PIN domain-containing protein [Nocardia asteroides]
MSLPTFHHAPVLVLDTNILRANPFPGATIWQRLAAGIRSGQLHVVIPEVVLRESARHRRQQMNKDREELRTAVATINRKLGPSRADSSLFRVPDTASVEAVLGEFSQADAERELRHEIVRAGFVVAPIPKVTQDEMLTWSLSGEPPFDNSDKGYRDALTWFCFCDVARDRRFLASEVILVSSDNDFGPQAISGVATFHAKLHQHLIDLLLIDRVFIAKKVDHVLGLLPKSVSHETLSDADRQLLLSTAVKYRCTAMAGQPLFWETADAGTEGWVENLELPSEIETLTFRTVTPALDSIVVGSAESYEDQTEVGSLIVQAGVAYDGFIYKHELKDVVDKVDVLDSDWNDQMMHVGSQFTARMDFSYVLLQREIQGVDLNRISAIEDRS